jgi:hypothetical protein
LTLKIHISEIKKYKYDGIYRALFVTVRPSDDVYLSDTRRELLILELKSQKNLVVISPKKTEELKEFLLRIPVE